MSTDFEKIRLVLDGRKEIIEASHQWSNDIGRYLLSIFNTIDDKETIEELSNYIYWNEFDVEKISSMSVKGVIKDIYLGVTGEKFKPQKLIGEACPACGEMVKVTSIQKLKEANGEGWRSDSPRELIIADLCCRSCYNLEVEKRNRPHNIIVYPNPNIHKNEKMDYQEYLQTEYWMVVREYIKKRDGGECVLCGSRENLHVHHKSYYHRGYEFRNDLHTLCGKCHRKYHNIQDGQK